MIISKTLIRGLVCLSECARSQGRPAAGAQPRCMHLGKANFKLLRALVSLFEKTARKRSMFR